MRVQIDHSEVERGGMFKKQRYHAVTCRVTFTQEELQIIRERNLGEYVVLERPPTLDMVKQARGIEDVFFLYIRNLVKGPDEYLVATPADAREYEECLLDKMPLLKDLLNANTEIEEKSKTLEF